MPSSLHHLDDDHSWPNSNMYVNDYTPQHLEKIAGPIKYYFARLPHSNHYAPNPTISSLYNSLTFADWSQPRSTSFLPSLQSLRYAHTYSSFNIYPTTPNSLQVNQLLWRVVRTGKYDPTEGDPLLGNHIFVLGIAPELHRFLGKVSLNEMHQAIIDFLVLLHYQLTTDGDVHGLQKMHQDLLPHIYDEMIHNLGVFPAAEPTDPHRASILENLVQISFMTPWRIDVFAAYLSAQDVTALSDLMHNPQSSLQSLPTVPLPSHSDETHMEKLLGTLMLRLYQDWRVYSAVLHDGMGLPYDQVTEAMERAIHARKSSGLFEQAFAVLQQSSNHNSFFSTLPPDLFERKLIPWLIRRGCEAIAPRRRRLASLQSLLDMSSTYLEDLHLIEDIAPHLDSETAQMLINLLDVGDDDLENTSYTTTSERIELGIVANRVLSNLHSAEVIETPFHPQVHTEEQPREGDSPRISTPSSSRFSVETSSIYPLSNVLWVEEDAKTPAESHL